jgi:LysR family transcriptional regulator, nod-box dependent transcriptional activator
MRLDRFDLNLLIALDVLLDERSVTRASQRLHIGQSGTSSALARLREHFSDELLLWDGKKCTLTPLAQQLQDPVRDALLRARAAVATRPGFSPAEAQRRFSVCASDYATTVLLGQALLRIKAQAPGVVVEIRTPQRSALETFERGGVDLMIMPEPYLEFLQHPRAPLFGDTQVCMVCASNAQVGEQLSFEQYLAMGHVIARFDDERTPAFEEWFLPRHGRQRRLEASVDNFSTLPFLVMGTTRIATLHRRMAQHFARHFPVRLLAAPFDMPPVVEAMVWPRYLDNDQAHVWLRQTLLDCAAELPALGQMPA